MMIIALRTYLKMRDLELGVSKYEYLHRHDALQATVNLIALTAIPPKAAIHPG
jgi:hypothetical protein